MQIIARRALREFWTKHSQAETPLKVWYAAVKSAAWKGPADVKATFGSNVDFVGDNRIIFDIGSNKYRLIAAIHFNKQILYVRAILTHADYDDWKP